MTDLKKDHQNCRVASKFISIFFAYSLAIRKGTYAAVAASTSNGFATVALASRDVNSKINAVITPKRLVLFVIFWSVHIGPNNNKIPEKMRTPVTKASNFALL